MKKILVFLTCFSIFQTQAQSLTQVYTPTADNVKTRTSFQDRKFGMFIHWGASSVLGDGEWVMENHGIQVNDYKKLNTVAHSIFLMAIILEIIFAVVFIAYCASYFFVEFLVFPVQMAVGSPQTTYASLLFLPHGMRVLSIWLYKERAVIPLFCGHLFIYILF